MKKAGQSQSGYAMAALLVALSVMAVLMTVAMPVWQQMAQREKEEELIFRGLQYVHAIGLFERKYANTPPPTLDVLVQEHLIRKKYKDPITNADFVPIPAAQAQAAVPGAGATQPARGATPAPTTSTAPTAPNATTLAAGRGTGVIGVTSSSNAHSIRIYNGASRYSDWRFVFTAATTVPGAGAAPGATTPGGRGGAGRQGPGGATPPGAPFGPNAPQGPRGGFNPGGRGGPNAPGAPGIPQPTGPATPGGR